jgi:carbon monoxide dehydrogenase subunit G
MTLEFMVNKNREELFRILTTPVLFSESHPVIYQISTSEDGKWIVYERFKTGPLVYKFSYPATVKTDRDKFRVTFHAVINKLVHLHMDFTFSELPGKTLVEEKVTINSWLPVAPLLKKVIRKQHKIWFDNIQTREYSTIKQ